MDPLGEEQLDYEDEEYGGSGPKSQFQGGGAIPALAEEELMGEDDEYDDLYNDVNVGEGFMQSLQQTEPPVSGNGAIQDPKDVPGSRVSEPAVSQDVSIPGIGVDKNDSNVAAAGFADAERKNSGFLSNKGLEEGSSDYPDQKPRVLDMAPETQVGNIGFRGPVPTPISQKIGADPLPMPGKYVGGASSLPDSSARIGQQPIPVNRMGMNRPMATMGTSVENGTTMLFVGELHWWTTDAELESELSRYGRVKEIKFYDERASGKSKGYCQVEFYDPAAAAACKEGMNGHMFNGRACVVAFASPQTLRQMGASYSNKTQMQAQSQQQQGRRIMNDGIGRGGAMNYQGGDGGGRNFGRGGWARGGQGLLNRGQGGGGPMRGRGPIGAKGMVGNTGGVGTSGNPYGQGLTGPGMGGPTAGLMHPQSMMGAGFDPTYMGRGAGYGGFSGPAFPGMMPSFPGVNTVALPGVAPHVNPAFFGRGVSANGMGIMGSSGMEGHHAGMWTDASMGRWDGEEHGRRTRESSYGGDDGASDYGYGEEGRERGGRSNASREKDRGSERDWSGNSERRHRDERDQDWERSDRDRYREEKDGYRDHRPRERDWDNEDDWDRGQSSSRSRSKSRMMQEEDHRSRSRDADYGKRRRLPSE